MVFSEGAAFTRTFLIEDEHKGFLFGDTTAVDRQFVIREFSIRYLQKGNLSKGNVKYTQRFTEGFFFLLVLLSWTILVLPSDYGFFAQILRSHTS